jgi:HD superfamily phosphodiesterase
MNYSKIAKDIIDLKNVDLKFREKLIAEKKLSEGYHDEMEKLHIDNAEKLNEIIDKIGFPTIENVGDEASESAWLIIQHAISKPKFMKKCLNLLENVVVENDAYEKKWAYLADRIAVLEGKPQLYGTQFDWDKNGALSPNTCDDLSKVNIRRLKMGLNTVEEQTVIIRARAKEENQTSPKNFNERQNEINIWKRKVGWIQ